MYMLYLSYFCMVGENYIVCLVCLVCVLCVLFVWSVYCVSCLSGLCTVYTPTNQHTPYNHTYFLASPLIICLLRACRHL